MEASIKQINFSPPPLRVEPFSGNRSFAVSIGLHLIALVFVIQMLMGLPPKLDKVGAIVVQFIDVPKIEEPPQAKVKSEQKKLITRIETKLPKSKMVMQPTNVANEPISILKTPSEIHPASRDEIVSHDLPPVITAILTSEPLLAGQNTQERETEAFPADHDKTISQELRAESSSTVTTTMRAGESLSAKPHVSDGYVDTIPISYEDLRSIEDNFALLIRKKIASAKTYPSASRKAGHEGKVLVAFALGKDGQIIDLAVDQSSGYERLDQAAMQAVKNASPYPPIPEKLRRESIGFKLPISFNLR